jgi:aryl sulfotransferase
MFTWENLRTWWEIKHLPNVRFVHFENLKKDMPGEIRRIAEFLEIPIDEEKWETILHHCSFDYMKSNAANSVPLGGAFWDKGAKVFINKGINGRWRDVLQEEDNQKYQDLVDENLPPPCAKWVATGELT